METFSSQTTAKDGNYQISLLKFQWVQVTMLQPVLQSSSSPEKNCLYLAGLPLLIPKMGKGNCLPYIQ
jgi:hypothetical protein